MNIFGWDIPVIFTWANGLSKSDPIIPYQFQGRAPRPSRWGYRVVAALCFLVVVAIFIFEGSR